MIPHGTEITDNGLLRILSLTITYLCFYRTEFSFKLSLFSLGTSSVLPFYVHSIFFLSLFFCAVCGVIIVGVFHRLIFVVGMILHILILRNSQKSFAFWQIREKDVRPACVVLDAVASVRCY